MRISDWSSDVCSSDLTGAPGGPNPKRLRNILENYPRDELFQIEEDELASSVLAIAQLRDRPRVRLLARTDPFDRFVSALLRSEASRVGEECAGRLGVGGRRIFNKKK